MVFCTVRTNRVQRARADQRRLWEQRVQKNNFYFLLIALLVLLLAVPLADDLELLKTPLVRGIIFSALLLVGIWSLRGGGYYFSIGMTFVVAGIVLNIVAMNLYSPIWQYCSFLSLIAFLLVSITFTLRQVVFSTEMSVNRLVGAVCIFLLIGVIWALVYTLVDFLEPASFTGVAAGPPASWDSGWLYFSFVTLTTLGYGDILPVSGLARTLAYLQAVAGQFYVAVLVAGLVSAYVSDKKGP